MVDVKLLYKINPYKFQEAVRGRTKEQFIDYLKQQPNFGVMQYLSKNDEEQLYLLAKGEITI